MAWTIKKGWQREVLFQLLLWALYTVVLIQQVNFYNERLDRDETVGWRELAFALNYFVAVMLLCYWILPQYLYRKRYIETGLFSIMLLIVVILVEEYVMERIFYGDVQRGKTFLGFLPTLLDIGPTILFFVGAKLAWDNLQKQNDLDQLKQEKVSSELQFLKSQLNPHFLFNNLNNLYSYAQEQSPKTGEIIMQLSAILRYMLYESQETFVPLKKELRYLEDFIQLQELQMEDRGHVSFQVTGETANYKIAPLVLIIFVENCFKHSLMSQAGDIDIQIRAAIEDGQLHFYCRNTFVETDNRSKQYLSRGIGLANVRKRLELLYPGKFTLDHRKEGHYYIVNLRMELSTINREVYEMSMSDY